MHFLGDWTKIYKPKLKSFPIGNFNKCSCCHLSQTYLFAKQSSTVPNTSGDHICNITSSILSSCLELYKRKTSFVSNGNTLGRSLSSWKNVLSNMIHGTIWYMTLVAKQTCYFRILGRYKKPTQLLKNKMLRKRPNCQGGAVQLWQFTLPVEKDL